MPHFQIFEVHKTCDSTLANSVQPLYYFLWNLQGRITAGGAIEVNVQQWGYVLRAENTEILSLCQINFLPFDEFLNTNYSQMTTTPNVRRLLTVNY